MDSMSKKIETNQNSTNTYEQNNNNINFNESVNRSFEETKDNIKESIYSSEISFAVCNDCS